MHTDSLGPAPLPDSAGPHVPWYRELNREHWFVLIVASLGWLFDTMDQQLFTIARVPAMRELVATEEHTASTPEAARALKQLVDKRSGEITAIFLIGWATGGLIFGVLGDWYGRAKVMAWTILIYSVFTGLSALSVGFWDFAFYRFLTGLGVGGEFAVGVALVAEVMPARARPFALATLQGLSAVGNVTAALISISLGAMEVQQAWRWMFVIGAVPALLVIVIRRHLKEPESWKQAVAQRKQGQGSRTRGTYAELFGDPVLRRNAIVGLLLALAGIVGLWGIGFFTVDLFDAVLRSQYEGSDLTAEEIDGKVGIWKGIVSIMQNMGGFLGVFVVAYFAHRLGRKPTFAIFFVLAGLSTAAVFAWLDTFAEVFWLVPLMGFCTLTLFGAYAIYFPELFPTRLRSTGTSFCYNVGRYVAALGPYTFGMLASEVFAHTRTPLTPDAPLRYAGITMCSVFLIGLLALPFAPETKDQPLPE